MAIFTQGKFQASLSENLKLIISHKSVKLICIILFVKLKYPLSLDVSNMNKESIAKLLITKKYKINGEEINWRNPFTHTHLVSTSLYKAFYKIRNDKVACRNQMAASCIFWWPSL